LRQSSSSSKWARRRAIRTSIAEAEAALKRPAGLEVKSVQIEALLSGEADGQ
jgi:hypothetical protein